MAFSTLAVDFTARLAGFEEGVNKAGRDLNNLSRRVDSAAAGIKGAFASIGVGLGVSAFAAIAKSGIDAADAMNDMSLRTGVAVKTLAGFKLAAEQSGTDLESMANGIQKLSLLMGQAEGGAKEQAAALQRLGVSARDPQTAFEQLADAVASSNDPIRTNADLQKVLGKNYAELLPLLQGGAQGLRDSAAASATFAEQMAKLAPDADKFNDNMAKLKTNTAGFASAILADLVPALNTLYERMTNLQASVGAGGFFASLGLSGTLNSDLPKLNKQIADIESTIARLKKNSGGLDSSIAPLSNQLNNLKKTRAALQELAVGQIQTPPKSGRPAAPAGTTDFTNTLATKTGKTSDPLAGLLKSTEIGKLKEFDAQVALLNQRFDFGRKSTDLYAQAMTKLVESTFSGNFTEFNRQMAEQDETQKLVADHLKATNDAIYAQQQAWSEAGAALTDEMRTPLEDANIEFGRLQELLDRGVISWETYTRAVLKTQDAISETPAKLEEMDTFAKNAAESIQQGFADFLFDPFDKGMKGMLQSFGQTLQRMIADAVAADLAKKLFGDSASGGSGSGVFGTVLSGIGSLFGFADGGIAANGRPLAVSLPRYAGGGVASSASIFGEAGPEAAVPLPDGRHIPVKMTGGGGNTIIVNVSGSNNAPDVRRAAGQGAREALGYMGGAKRYA